MGEVRVCAQPSNAVFGEDTGPRTLILPSGNPNYVNISAENWILAEELTEKLIRKVQPTKVADEKRREISEHVRSLIRGVSYAEVIRSLKFLIFIDYSLLFRRVLLVIIVFWKLYVLLVVRNSDQEHVCEG